MKITTAAVLHVAKLARLELDDAEVVSLARDLTEIIEYIDELSTVPTEGVPPTAHITVEQLPTRDDEVSIGLDHDTVFAEAPRENEGGFAVPSFVDEG